MHNFTLSNWVANSSKLTFFLFNAKPSSNFWRSQFSCIRHRNQYTHVCQELEWSIDYYEGDLRTLFFNSLRPHFEYAILAKYPITTTLKDRAATGLVKGRRGSYPQHTLQQNNISNIAQQCAVINQINVDHLIADHSLVESIVVVKA